MEAAFIRIGIVVLPFCFLSLGAITKGHAAALFILTAWVLGARMWRHSRPLALFLWYFGGWHLFVRLRLVLQHTSLDNHLAANAAAPSMVYVILVAVILVAVIESRPHVKHRVWYFWFCLAAIIQASLAAIQATGHFPVFSLMRSAGMSLEIIAPFKILGTLQNPNFIAVFLAICFPFFLRPRWIYGTPLLATIIYLAETSTAVIGLAAGLAIYAWHYRADIVLMATRTPRAAMAGIFAAIVLIGFAPVYATVIDKNVFTDIRWGFWATAAGTWFSSPMSAIFGRGPGQYFNPAWLYLHNDWLRTGLELGMIGVGLLLWAVWDMLRRYAQPILLASLVTGCVCMIGTYPTKLAASALLIIVVMGLILREKSSVHKMNGMDRQKQFMMGL